MSWLARLKTGKTPMKDATKTTETLFVVSVAPTLAPLQKNKYSTKAANDTAPAPTPMAAIVDVGALPCFDPDAYCWPNSNAMNGAEIGLFTARRHRFTDKGLIGSDSETLADKLVTRDRESDDRRVCLECIHLTGHETRSWRCGNWQAAGVAHQARDAQLAFDLVVLPQRCYGFTAIKRFTPPNMGRCEAEPKVMAIVKPRTEINFTIN
jgi:hypothetical protein